MQGPFNKFGATDSAVLRNSFPDELYFRAAVAPGVLALAPVPESSVRAIESSLISAAEAPAKSSEQETLADGTHLMYCARNSAERNRRRVLVVEDNRDSAISLCVLLELMGHEVRLAYTGPEAVVVAASWPPEITISDIGLPGFDGFEVARRLRVLFGKRLLLVALTGYGSDEDRRQSQAAGFDHHLVKPADPAVLQRMLADCGDK